MVMTKEEQLAGLYLGRQLHIPHRVGGINVDGARHLAYLQPPIDGQVPLLNHFAGPGGHHGGAQDSPILFVDQFDKAGVLAVGPGPVHPGHGPVADD